MRTKRAIKIPSVALDGPFRDTRLRLIVSYEANKNSVLSIGFIASKCYLSVISNSFDCERFLSDSYGHCSRNVSNIYNTLRYVPRIVKDISHLRSNS